MTWLSKFESIVKARTPGKWIYETERYSAQCVIGIKPIDDRWIATFQPGFNGESNGRFATLSANVADEVLELVSATDAYLTSRRIVGKELDWDMYERLEKALVKMAAKVSGQ